MGSVQSSQRPPARHQEPEHSSGKAGWVILKRDQHDIEGAYDRLWWEAVSDDIARAAESYRSCETCVTLENIPCFDGYYVPLPTPQDLLAFVSANELGVTLDTTHYAQMGTDVVQAASALSKKTKTLHLSDYVDGNTHVFVGDGTLDFLTLFRVLDPAILHSVTLECSVGFVGENPLTLTPAEMVDRLKTARSRLEKWLEAACDKRA